MTDKKGSRIHVLAALERILEVAADTHIEALDQALRDRREIYPRRGRMPLFLAELIDTLEGECGYRFRREEGTDQEDCHSPEGCDHDTDQGCMTYEEEKAS